LEHLPGQDGDQSSDLIPPAGSPSSRRQRRLDRAVGTRGGVCDPHLAIQVVRQAALDQARPEALVGGRLHCRAAQLVLLQQEEGWRARMVHHPVQGHLSRCIGERPVLGRVRGQLMEGQAERKRLFRLEMDLAALAHRAEK